MVKRNNQITTLKTLGVGTLVVGTTGTIPTLSSTYGTVTGLSSANAKVTTKLVIPTTAYTGSAPTEAGIYVTGSYLIVGNNGAAWASAALS